MLWSVPDAPGKWVVGEGAAVLDGAFTLALRHAPAHELITTRGLPDLAPRGAGAGLAAGALVAWEDADGDGRLVLERDVVRALPRDVVLLWVIGGADAPGVTGLGPGYVVLEWPACGDPSQGEPSCDAVTVRVREAEESVALTTALERRAPQPLCPAATAQPEATVLVDMAMAAPEQLPSLDHVSCAGDGSSYTYEARCTTLWSVCAGTATTCERHRHHRSARADPAGRWPCYVPSGCLPSDPTCDHVDPRAAAADNSAIVVAGRVHLAALGDALWLRKLSETGVVAWTVTPLLDAAAQGVALGPNGEVAVTANSDGQEAWLVLLEPDGSLRWKLGPELGLASADAPAIDAQGFVAIAGSAMRGGVSGVVVQRRTSDGDEVFSDWVAHGQEVAKHADVGVDPDGNVYVIATVGHVGQGANIWLRKYAPTGTVLWTTETNSNQHRDDIGHALALDTDGRLVILIGGLKRDADGSIDDLAMRRIAPEDGSVSWSSSANASSGDVAYDPAGKVWFAGWTAAKGSLLMKLAGNGDPVFALPIPEAGEVTAIASPRNGGAVVVGRNPLFVGLTDSDGGWLWTRD